MHSCPHVDRMRIAPIRSSTRGEVRKSSRSASDLGGQLRASFQSVQSCTTVSAKATLEFPGFYQATRVHVVPSCATQHTVMHVHDISSTTEQDFL